MAEGNPSIDLMELTPFVLTPVRDRVRAKLELDRRERRIGRRYATGVFSSGVVLPKRRHARADAAFRIVAVGNLKTVARKPA